MFIRAPPAPLRTPRGGVGLISICPVGVVAERKLGVAGRGKTGKAGFQVLPKGAAAPPPPPPAGKDLGGIIIPGGT